MSDDLSVLSSKFKSKFVKDDEKILLDEIMPFGIKVGLRSRENHRSCSPKLFISPLDTDCSLHKEMKIQTSNISKIKSMEGGISSSKHIHTHDDVKRVAYITLDDKNIERLSSAEFMSESISERKNQNLDKGEEEIPSDEINPSMISRLIELRGKVE